MKKIILLLIAFAAFVACTDIEVITPKGEQGPKGENGISAYETWLALLDKGTYPDWKGGKTEADFILFLTGKDGMYKAQNEAYITPSLSSRVISLFI